MRDYSARRERSAGRRTIDDTRNLIYFGPGRDSTALTGVVSDILHLEVHYASPEPERRRVFERTESGKHFWVDPRFAKVINIQTADPGGMQETEDRQLATVHDAVEGIISYVGLRSVFPDRVMQRLMQSVFPSRELATTPQVQADTLSEQLGAEVIPLYGPGAEMPEPALVPVAI